MLRIDRWRMTIRLTKRFHLEDCTLMETSRLRDWGLLLACNLIWASQFVMVKLVQEQMGPVFATFFPMTLATVLLIPIVRRERRKNPAWPPDRMPKKDMLEFILIGVLGQVVAQL